jgi:DNA polymerase-1
MMKFNSLFNHTLSMTQSSNLSGPSSKLANTTTSKSPSPQRQKKGQRGPTVIEPELRIDADFFAYRSCQVNETELDWGDDLITIASNFKEVTKVFSSEINNLKKRFDTERVLLYFSDSKNFRKLVDPDYKGKRTKRKPVGYKRLLDWCKDHFKIIRYENLEADDALGLECHLDPSDFILVSPDKDMKQISCNLFNGSELVQVTPEEADYWFWTQCLTGDPVDGYKGVPGIGAKGAQKILAKAEDPWQAVLSCYEKAGMTEADAIRNARLARILRPGEYNSTTKEPILWNPPPSSLDSTSA